MKDKNKSLLDQLRNKFTHRENSEKELRASNQQLTSSEQQLRAANQQLEANNQQLIASEKEIKRHAHDLGERIKELDCLYSISKIVEIPDISLDEIVQRVVNIIPSAGQYPEKICAKITLLEKEFKTENFKESKWKHTCDIKINRKRAGKVEVCYLEQIPDSDERPFLKEEKILLDNITERLGRIVERKQAEQQLRAANQQFIANGQQLRASNQQLTSSEQQLRAANQQLTSSEQQLRAANQQLEANNQQLIASEEGIKKEKEFSENLLKTANAFILTIDINANITLFNKFAEKLTGYKKEEVLGKNWFELFIPKRNGSVILEVFSNVIKEMPEFSSYENLILCKNGSERLISWENTVLKNENGEISGVLSIGNDITKRKQAEVSLRENEEKYRTIFEATGTAILIVDEETTIIQANKECGRVTGYAASELVGKSWTKFVSEEDLLTMLKNAKARIKDPKSVPNKYEVRLINAKGEIRNTIISIGMISGSKTSIVSMIDITERKKAEETLKQSEAQYKDLAEKGNIAIVVDDIDGNLLYYNKQFSDLFGYSMEQMKKQNHKTLIHPDDFKRVSHSHKNNIQGRKILSRYEFKGVKKDGTAIDIEISVSSIIEKDNKIIGTRSYLWNITERKQAEEKLRESENNLRTLFNAMTDVVFEMDYDGHYLNIAPTSPDLLYKPSNEVLGKTLHEVFPKPGADVFLEFIRKCLDENKTNTMEYPMIINDKTIWFEGRVTPKTNNSVLYIARDITERKQAEEALKENEERYKQMYQFSPDSIIIHDMDMNILDANNKAVEEFGYSKVELLKKTIFELHPENELKHSAQVLAAMNKKDMLNVETKCVRKDGSIFLVDVTPCKYMLGSKPVIHVVIRDITERKKAEEKLKESEEKYRLIVENANDGIEITQEDKIIFANRQFAEILGYKLDELKDIPFSQIFAEEAISDLNDRHEKREAGMVVPHQYETTFKKKDGTVIDVYIKYEIIDYKQKPATFAIISDITDRKKTEKELAKHREHLEELVKERTKELEEVQKQLIQKERLAVLGQLSGGVAHELRNPLGVISNSIYYLNMKLKDKDEKVKKHLGLIKKEIERSDNMIIELLDFSKVKLLYITETNVNTLIKETIKETKIPEHIDLKMDLDEKIPQLQLDLDKMQKVFQNMISNALQSMPEKGKLHIKTSSNDDFTEISFSDNGQGIIKENLKKIFKPLVTTRAKGIGLGLAIAKNIIDYHKGKIDVKSEVGKGTTFTIKLRNYEVEKL